MNFYDRWVLPPILDLVMRQNQLRSIAARWLPRQRTGARSRGRFGAELFTLRQAGRDCIRDRSFTPVAGIARRRADVAGLQAELLQGSAIAIPLADSTIDTVVMTWALCSITDPLAALREMRRVLKPDGTLLFVEHGLSPEPGIERWQHRLTPIWCHIAGGCHLDRKMDDLIRSAGFDLIDLRTAYASGPRPMTYMYLGRASRH